MNGTDYGYDISFVNSNFHVNGTNIVYGSHPYNEKGTPNWTGPGGSFANNFAGVIHTYPLIFTEFGVNQSSYFPTGYEAVYDRILAYADSYEINYSGFAWWVEANRQQANVFPCLIADWNGATLNGGVQIKEDMDTRPGTPIDSLEGSQRFNLRPEY